jgi:MFS family permease
MSNTAAVNPKRLLFAGFMAILAAGIGFAIRGAILDNWGSEFGFTGAELGVISGAGFTGFCFGIIFGGVIADKIGYGKLVIAAFVFHILSAVITFAASPGMEKVMVFNYLFWGMFIFAVANGTLEAVANPLVATLFFRNRTHYLNILHASWPAGLVLGGIAGWFLDDKFHWHWKYQLALFLIPTVLYGLMFLGQRMPKSEASEKGLSLGEMFKDVGLLGGAVVCFLLALFLKSVLGPMFPEGSGMPSYISWGIAFVLLLTVGGITNFAMGHWLLFALFVAHALVGAVELGTDGWIQNITGNILTSEQGKVLFVLTSLLMFSLRFCADFIEKRLGLSPIGILLISAVLACIGLNLVSGIHAFGGAMLALVIYGVGKTFFWPTMLAVASDRFPRTGAIAISIMGGIGMMSAGLIGTPGLGYAKDRFAGEALKQNDPVAFEQFKAETPSKFLFFAETTGLDGKKLGAVYEKLSASRAASAKTTDSASVQLTANEKIVVESSIQGDRKTLKADSFIPTAMALIFLGILVYFKGIGGYKPIHINEEESVVKKKPAREMETAAR